MLTLEHVVFQQYGMVCLPYLFKAIIVTLFVFSENRVDSTKYGHRV